MTESFDLIAERRDDRGKGASRRLRRIGRVPGIIYGGDKPSIAISVEGRILYKQLENDAFYSHVLTVKLDGGSQEKVVLRDLQRHPAQPFILHFDLMRVNEDTPVRVHVPIHFINEATAPGVKMGGMVNHHIVEVEITCLPRDLPEAIEVDLGNLEMNEAIHLSDMKLPNGVSLDELAHGEGHDQSVVSIHQQRVSTEDIDEEESSSEGESSEES